jgi:hypothetical protein
MIDILFFFEIKILHFNRCFSFNSAQLVEPRTEEFYKNMQKFLKKNERNSTKRSTNFRNPTPFMGYKWY